jgi:hypothetical protein
MKHDRLPERMEKALNTLQQDIPGPNPARQAAARRAFLAEARRLRQQQPVSGREAIRHIGWVHNLILKKESFAMTTLLRASALIGLLSVLVVGTALAADASLPGQLLYPVDLTVEQVGLALARTPEARADLSLELATERTDELIALAEEGTTPDQAGLDRLQVQLQECLATATQLQQQDRIQLLTQLRDMAQQQASEFEELGRHQEATIMIRTREQAQLGIDDPVGFQARQRDGLGWQEEEPVEEPEPTEEATDEPALESVDEANGPDRDRDQDQLQDCEPGTGDCEPAQDQIQGQQQDRDQLRDGTCDDDGDCVPNGDGEHQGPPPDQSGAQSQGGGSSGGSGGHGGGRR